MAETENRKRLNPKKHQKKTESGRKERSDGLEVMDAFTEEKRVNTEGITKNDK